MPNAYSSREKSTFEMPVNGFFEVFFFDIFSNNKKSEIS